MRLLLTTIEGMPGSCSSILAVLHLLPLAFDIIYSDRMDEIGSIFLFCYTINYHFWTYSEEKKSLNIHSQAYQCNSFWICLWPLRSGFTLRSRVNNWKHDQLFLRYRWSVECCIPYSKKIWIHNYLYICDQKTDDRPMREKEMMWCELYFHLTIKFKTKTACNHIYFLYQYKIS